MKVTVVRVTRYRFVHVLHLPAQILDVELHGTDWLYRCRHESPSSCSFAGTVNLSSVFLNAVEFTYGR